MRNKQLGKLTRLYSRELLGKACSFCGGKTYQLALNASGKTDAGLYAHCTHCRRWRRLGQDLGRVLWA